MDRCVELAGEHHRGDALAGGNLMHPHARRRREARRAAVAELGRALHEELHVLRAHAPFMLKRAARPQRAGLLIFGHADALALQVFGLLDPRALAHENVRMKKAARGEDRQADETIVALGHRNDERGERHLRNVEIREAQLAPEQFGGAHDAGGELDPLRLRAPVEHRTGADVFGEGDAESELHAILPSERPAGRFSFSSPRIRSQKKKRKGLAGQRREPEDT